MKSYIKANPSKHTSLRDYCENKPNYLKQTPPFSEHPILAELARSEQTLLFSFDANNASIAEWEQLNSLKPEDWPNLKIHFHPSLQIFETKYNCVEIWQALKQQVTPSPVMKHGFTAWALWRNPERITEFRSIERCEVTSIRAFLKGKTLAEVCELLLADYGENEVSKVVVHFLTQWLSRHQVAYLLSEYILYLKLTLISRY